MNCYLFLLLIVSSCISVERQPSYSHNPIEEEIFNLKGQRREMDANHRKLLATYFKNECPKTGTFGLWQILTQRQWVSQCKAINQELNDSHAHLMAIDKQIEILKLKQSE